MLFRVFFFTCDSWRSNYPHLNLNPNVEKEEKNVILFLRPRDKDHQSEKIIIDGIPSVMICYATFCHGLLIIIPYEIY